MADSGLSSLITTEKRLAQILAAAEAEARGRLTAAGERTAALEADDLRRLEQELAALAARVAAERDAEIERLTSDAAARCRRLAGAEEVFDTLARETAERLLPAGNVGP
jgi:hypothetical protein